jgi:DNA-binding response OmpR family regulator
MAKVLLIEDDVEVASTIRDNLLLSGHTVEFVSDPDKALDWLKFQEYDLIVVNPFMTGSSVNGNFCSHYRSTGGPARIIAISDNSSSVQIERILDAGADDIVTKPVDIREFGARVRALMRRSLTIIGTNLMCGDLVLDLNARTVTRGQEQVHLLPQEFALLEFLMRNPNRVFNAETLIQRVWRGNSSLNTVRTHIKTLRKKVDREGLIPLIRTVHGVGYGLKLD